MLGERLDVVDSEFCYDFGRELCEVQTGKFGVAIAVIGDVDVGAEWVGSYSDAIAWRRGEVDVRGCLARPEGARSVSREKAAGGKAGDFLDEGASSQRVHIGCRGGVGDCTRTVADPHGPVLRESQICFLASRRGGRRELFISLAG